MKYYVVDAFADKVFEGNPAGVCVMNDWLDEELMQKIAAENNLSETAFAVGGDGRYRLRWFTPGGEIDLCGHATLATAYVITRFVEPRASKVVFDTMSGVMQVDKLGDRFELDFPARMPAPVPLTDPMTRALGIRPLESYLSRDLMFVLESPEQVRDLKPDFTALSALPDGVGALVTAKGMDGFDFVSRAFFPKLGVNEDPVCGSAHCNFIPFWSKRLGKETMVARQLSARGGTLYCQHRGDRVKIAGKAALYAVGEILADENQEN